MPDDGEFANRPAASDDFGPDVSGDSQPDISNLQSQFAASDDGIPATSGMAGGPEEGGGARDLSSGVGETEGGLGEEGAEAQAAVADLEAKLAELNDQYLRKAADFENYRKRMQREKSEFAAYATRELLTDIVAIIDDFERAIKSADESHDFNAFHDGIVMIEKQFTGMLERKWKLTRFDSVGEEFDPQRHEAMMTDESPGIDQPTVTEDFQKGYMLQDKVLRPAKVKVSMPAADAQGNTAATDGGAEDEGEASTGGATRDS